MENRYSVSLGDCVREGRKKKNLTQAQLADAIHSDKRTILNIENYRGNPKLDTLADLITKLDINPNYIFFPDLPKKTAMIKEFESILAKCSDEQVKMIIEVCRAIVISTESNEQYSAI